MAVRSIRTQATPALFALACAAALTAACGSPAASGAAPAASGGAPQRITVTMTEFAFALDHPPTAAGAYVFHAVNAGKYPHAVELDGAGVSDQKSTVVQPGASTDLPVTLQTGDLDMYCPVDGHRAKGMETHLTIGAAGTGGGAGGY
jgi:plastocyanin